MRAEYHTATLSYGQIWYYNKTSQLLDKQFIYKPLQRSEKKVHKTIQTVNKVSYYSLAYKFNQGYDEQHLSDQSNYNQKLREA